MRRELDISVDVHEIVNVAEEPDERGIIS